MKPLGDLRMASFAHCEEMVEPIGIEPMTSSLQS